MQISTDGKRKKCENLWQQNQSGSISGPFPVPTETNWHRICYCLVQFYFTKSFSTRNIILTYISMSVHTLDLWDERHTRSHPGFPWFQHHHLSRPSHIWELCRNYSSMYYGPHKRSYKLVAINGKVSLRGPEDEIQGQATSDFIHCHKTPHKKTVKGRSGNEGSDAK